MKVLIQHHRNYKYLKMNGKWVKDSMKARVFSSSISATQFALNHHLKNVHVRLKFHAAGFDIKLPLIPSYN
jgi:hypothetical protein